jgi:hypothetical protein
MRFSSSPKPPDRMWGLAVSYSVDVGGSFSGDKQPGHEAEHSPASSPEVKKWGYTSTPTVCLNGMHKDNYLLLQHLYLFCHTAFANKLLNHIFFYI